MRDSGRRNRTVAESAASFLLSSLDETPSFRSAPSKRANRRRRSSRRAMRSEHEKETNRGSSAEGYKTLPPREIFVKASNSSEKKTDSKMAAAVSDSHSKKLITDSSYQEADQPKSPHPREAGDKETQIFTFDGFTLVSTGDDEMRQERSQRRTAAVNENDEREEVAAMQTPLYSLNLRGKKPNDSVNEERTVVSQSIQWLLSEQEIEVPFDEEPVSILGSTSYAMSFMPSERSPRHRFGDSFSDESSSVFFKSSSPVHRAPPPTNGEKVSKVESSIVTSIPPLVPKQEQTNEKKPEESDALTSFYQNMTCLNTDAIEDREESCPYVFHDANSQSSDSEDHDAICRLRASDGVFGLESPDPPTIRSFDENSPIANEEEVDPLFEQEVERLVAECSNEASMEQEGSPSCSARFRRVNVLAGIDEDDSVALSEQSSIFEQHIKNVTADEVASKVSTSTGQNRVESQPATTEETTTVVEFDADAQASIQVCGASPNTMSNPIDIYCPAETEGQHCCSSDVVVNELDGNPLPATNSDKRAQSDVLEGGSVSMPDHSFPTTTQAGNGHGRSAQPDTLTEQASKGVTHHQSADVVTGNERPSALSVMGDPLKDRDAVETRSRSRDTRESKNVSAVPESSTPLTHEMKTAVREILATTSTLAHVKSVPSSDVAPDIEKTTPTCEEAIHQVTTATLDGSDNGRCDSVPLPTKSPSGKSTGDSAWAEATNNQQRCKNHVNHEVAMGNNDPQVGSALARILPNSRSTLSQPLANSLFMDTPEDEPGRIHSPTQRRSASTDFAEKQRESMSGTPQGPPRSWVREKTITDSFSWKSLESKFEYAVKSGSSSLSIGLLARSFTGGKSSDCNEGEFGTRTRPIDEELAVKHSIQPKSLDDETELQNVKNTEHPLDRAFRDKYPTNLSSVTLSREARKSDKISVDQLENPSQTTDSSVEQAQLSATRITVQSNEVQRQNLRSRNGQACGSTLTNESMGDANQDDAVIRRSSSPTGSKSIQVSKNECFSDGPSSISLADTHSRSTLLDSARLVIKSIESSIIHTEPAIGLETGNGPLITVKVPKAVQEPDGFEPGVVKDVSGAGFHVKESTVVSKKEEPVVESEETTRPSPLVTSESPLLIPIDSPTDTSQRERRTSQNSDPTFSQLSKSERTLLNCGEDDRGDSKEEFLTLTGTPSEHVGQIDEEPLHVLFGNIRLEAEGCAESCDCGTPLTTNKTAITDLPDLVRSMANTTNSPITTKELDEILAKMDEPDYGESPAVSREEVVFAIDGTFSRTDDGTRETCRYSASYEFTEDGTMGSRTSSLLPELESKIEEKKNYPTHPSMTSVFDDDDDDDNVETAPSDEVPINRVESMDYTTGTGTLIFTSSSSGEYVTSLITGTESEAEGCTADIMKLNTTELSKLPLEAQKCAADICQMNNCF